MVNYEEPRVRLTDTQLNKWKVYTSKINQSSGSFGPWLGHLGKKKEIKNFAIHFSRFDITGLVCNTTLNAINKFERKIIGKRAVRSG